MAFDTFVVPTLGYRRRLSSVRPASIIRYSTPSRCLDVSFQAGVRFPWPLVAIASFTSSYGSGTARKSFLNGSWILFCGMDHEDASAAWLVPALRRSYARRRAQSGRLAFPTHRGGLCRRVFSCCRSRMTNDRTSTRPWSVDEEAELLSLFAAGATAEEVGERLRRTRQAVYARLQRFQKQRGRASRKSGKSFAQLPPALRQPLQKAPS